MYSLKHVLWRGAMALSLLTLGVGGVGFQQEPLQARTEAPACDSSADVPAKLRFIDPRQVDEHALALLVVRQAGKRS